MSIWVSSELYPLVQKIINIIINIAIIKSNTKKPEFDFNCSDEPLKHCVTPRLFELFEVSILFNNPFWFSKSLVKDKSLFIWQSHPTWEVFELYPLYTQPASHNDILLTLYSFFLSYNVISVPSLEVICSHLLL